jgi:hypothetical protein
MLTETGAQKETPHEQSTPDFKILIHKLVLHYIDFRLQEGLLFAKSAPSGPLSELPDASTSCGEEGKKKDIN